MFLNIGTPKTINFPFGTNGKLMALGVPILKHIRVSHYRSLYNDLASLLVMSLMVSYFVLSFFSP